MKSFCSCESLAKEIWSRQQMATEGFDKKYLLSWNYGKESSQISKSKIGKETRNGDENDEEGGDESGEEERNREEGRNGEESGEEKCNG